MRARVTLAATFCLAALEGEPSRVRAAPLIVDDPAALIDLEEHGFSFADVVGRRRLRAIKSVVEDDMREFTSGQPKDSPRRPFNPAWLTRGHFELVAVVNRFDRRGFDPNTCGEVRLVYRLALQNKKRPATRLPMTVNVRIPQPRKNDCRTVAREWLAGENLASMLRKLPPLAKIEINFQSIHVPAFDKDMDDTAEYVLRAFDDHDGELVVDTLFNTPRALTAGEKAELLAWIRDHLDEIDRAVAVLPERFLATRAVSVSPRGLARSENRPYAKLLAANDLADLPLEKRFVAKTPELLLRRLDESTCTGCHQTRGIAGFHLFGEERTKSSFNALAVGHSPHLTADLHWRAVDLEAAANGDPPPPRPFAAYPNGAYGSECGLTSGMSDWSCAPGLVCRDIHGSDVGVCAPKDGGSAPGEPCEDARIEPSDRQAGPIMHAEKPDATCPAPPEERFADGPFCAPNWLGFTGGMCSERCSTLGEIRGRAICAPLPAAYYESDCFLSTEPIETCLKRHFVSAFVARCDAKTPCRDDYGCARVPNAPLGTGACVPPYFIFQARVAGPKLDR